LDNAWIVGVMLEEVIWVKKSNPIFQLACYLSASYIQGSWCDESNLAYVLVSCLVSPEVL